MRKLISAAALGGILATFSMTALAQTTTTQPKSQADCKGQETFDPATQTCKPGK